MKKLTVLTLAVLLTSTTAISAMADETVVVRENEKARKETADTTWSATKDKINAKINPKDAKSASAKKTPTSTEASAAAASEAKIAPSATKAVTAPVTSQEFIQRAIYGNNFEIKSSEEVNDSDNKSVKEFAKKIIDDHKKAEDNLKAAIKSSPNKDTYEKIEPEDDLDAQQKVTLEQIKDAAKGTERDTLYIKAQLDAHKETVSLFKEYAANGDDAKLKEYASRTLPVLEGHQKHVEGLAK